MKRIILYLILISFLIPGEAILMAQGSFPLSVSVRLGLPYPTRLSDFTDIESRVFIDVLNTSTESYSIVLTGKLETDTRGISIRTDPGNPPDHAIIINPGNNPLDVSDLGDLFDPNHLIMQGTSAAEIRRDAALPEGEYTLCIRAFDAENPGRALSPDPELVFSGCAQFNVSYIDEPEITNPFNEQSVSTTNPVLPIQWLWNRSIFAADNVTFSLRIVEIDPSGRDPNDVLATSTTPELFFQDGIMETFYNLNLPDDALLEPGESYIIQVIATDETGELTFKNGGRSEPVVFRYREPNLSIGSPRWVTESGASFASESDIAIEYEIPFPEDTEGEIARDIYIFEIPQDMDPEIAYALGDFTLHENRIVYWDNDANPQEYAEFGSSLVFGTTYGAKIVISDPMERDDVFFESGGESQILVFDYGESILVPKPYWITDQDTTYDSPEDVNLEYRIQMRADRCDAFKRRTQVF